MTEPRFVTTPLAASIHAADENPIFGEGAIQLRLEDEAGGPFFVLRTNDDGAKPGEIRIDPDQMKALTEAAKALMKNWRGEW